MPHCYERIRTNMDRSWQEVSMPSRADTSFLRYVIEKVVESCNSMCQCPLGLIPHFYGDDHIENFALLKNVSMPSRADTSFLPYISRLFNPRGCYVSMPSRADTSFLHQKKQRNRSLIVIVSMPSRADTSFLHQILIASICDKVVLCQCPLGLIPHFYPATG